MGIFARIRFLGLFGLSVLLLGSTTSFDADLIEATRSADNHAQLVASRSSSTLPPAVATPSHHPLSPRGGAGRASTPNVGGL